MASFEVINGEAVAEMERLARRGVRVGMCLCDPPQEKTAAEWDKIIPFEPMWGALRRLVAPDRANVIFGNDPFASLLVASNWRQYRHEWIWQKNRKSNFLNAGDQPMREHEQIKVFSEEGHEHLKVFSKEPPAYFPQKTSGHKPIKLSRRRANSSTLYEYHAETFNKAGETTRFPSSILPFDGVDNCSAERVHANQKPVPLLRYLIRTYTEPGDLVLDFTAGSFSAGVAAVVEGRDFVGIEMDEFMCRHGEAWMRRALGNPVPLPKPIPGERHMPLFNPPRAGAQREDAV